MVKMEHVVLDNLPVFRASCRGKELCVRCQEVPSDCQHHYGGNCFIFAIYLILMLEMHLGELI